jgi:hypothetical protein
VAKRRNASFTRENRLRFRIRLATRDNKARDKEVLQRGAKRQINESTQRGLNKTRAIRRDALALRPQAVRPRLQPCSRGLRYGLGDQVIDPEGRDRSKL